MERQPELFSEFKDIETKDRLFQKGILSEKTFTFAYDKLILLSLGFIILLAIVFAFGFEQGKRNILVKRTITQPVNRLPATTTMTAPAPKKITVQDVPKPYTIQVATFKSKELAQKETEKLKIKGLSTMVIGINGLYQVWVGEYSDPKEAYQILNMLKKSYKDCYIRKR